MHRCINNIQEKELTEPQQSAGAKNKETDLSTIDSILEIHSRGGRVTNLITQDGLHGLLVLQNKRTKNELEMTCNKNGGMTIVRNLLCAINNIMSSGIALEIPGMAASYSILRPGFISPKKKRRSPIEFRPI